MPRQPIQRRSLDDAPNPLTVEDLAPILLKSPGRIREMAKAGKLPGLRVGNRWLFGKRAIERFLNGEWSPTPTSQPKTDE
jgi:excisionase family DNA binding protein